MRPRKIQQERSFTDELAELFESAKEADEVLEGATLFFSTRAERGKQLPDTRLYHKIISDFQRDRFLVIFYLFDEDTVYLHSIKAFGT